MTSQWDDRGRTTFKVIGSGKAPHLFSPRCCITDSLLVVTWFRTAITVPAPFPVVALQLEHGLHSMPGRDAAPVLFCFALCKAF